MSEHIDAIFDGGVFKPLVPLSLPEKSVVRLTIDAAENDKIENEDGALQPQDEWERNLFTAAKDSGVSLTDTAVSSEGLYE
jgi:predicted DNA-binding antitoxin AbrB/MazE fold protein